MKKIEELLKILICPETGQNLIYDEEKNCLFNTSRTISYPIENNIPILTKIEIEIEQNDEI